jgi:hypothetical protein
LLPFRSVFPQFARDEAANLDDTANNNSNITVMKAISYKATNIETGEADVERIRCDKDFLGAPWQDGVMVLEQNPNAGDTRHCEQVTQTGLRIFYEADAERSFAIVHLMFQFGGKLWLLLEMLEGADNNRTKPPWQNRIIPNWAHLRTQTGSRGNAPLSWSTRLQVLHVDSVERVRVIVPDPNQPLVGETTVIQYWSPADTDSVHFPQVFYEGSKYERYGTLDATGRPVRQFEGAVLVQPWDLCPPSARQMREMRNMNRNADRDFRSNAQEMHVRVAQEDEHPGS